MSIQFNSECIPGRHTLHYRVRDSHKDYPTRDVEVLATTDEISELARDGYLIRERLIPSGEIQRLRDALDETVARDDHLEQGGGKSFGGVFIRHLMDKHPAFLEFLNFQPTLSVACALFGPAVQMRGFTGRICYPEDPNQETTWHFHQRLVPEPIPPLFAKPQTLDVLLYLDDINELNGPLCVVPGSHNWMEKDLAAADFEDKPGQVEIRVPAGSAVFTHGALWHRARPTRPGGTRRRLLLYGYGPAWMKTSIYGEPPPNGLTAQLLRTPNLDEEIREQLGVAGFM